MRMLNNHVHRLQMTVADRGRGAMTPVPHPIRPLPLAPAHPALWK